MSGASNRRAFVRQDDDVLLKLRKLDDDALQRAVADLTAWRLGRSPGDSHLPTRHHLQRSMRRLRDSMPEVAAYLAHLERRLDLLSRELSRGLPGDDGLRSVRANISARGLRAESPDAFACGDMLETSLVLLPDCDEVAAIGRVIRTIPSRREGLHVVSLHFDHILETDHETLIRHVHRLQREMLARRRRVA